MSMEHAVDEPIAQYEITETGASKKVWSLSLYPDHFRLESPGGEPHEVDRAELPERVQTFDRSLFLQRVLVVKLGKKQGIFKLSEEAFTAFSAWIGPPTRADLKLCLKRRLSWITPIGYLFVLTALPIGDLPWNPINFALGLALILTGTLAKVRPHRVYFALDSLWFSFLAANTLWMQVQQWSWWRLVVILVQLALVRSGWRDYRRFAPERMAAAEDQGPGTEEEKFAGSGPG